jgi:PilZ domain
MEHRWGARVPVDLAVRVATRRFSVRPGRLLNVSLSGAAIESAIELRPLSRVQLAISSSHRSAQATAMVGAYVARRYPGGFGLEWCDFAPQAILELLRAHSPKSGVREVPVRIDAVLALPEPRSSTELDLGVRLGPSGRASRRS